MDASIKNYFDSTCRIIIDEFNFILKGLSLEEKQDYANNKFCEADLAYRLGSPFRQMARYPMHGTKSKDIIVDYNEFEVEVKYWRNWEVGSGKQKINWEPSFPNAIFWLCDEIDKGYKGKRAFIAGWSTVFGWNDLLRLGSTSGKNPKVNMDRLHMIPFLNCTDGYFQTVKTQYNLRESIYRIMGRNSIINWSLYGNENDDFNMCIFW
ncbi:hypothetical protein [Clostridium sp. BNL1100]|uniref:hypothetical protein n=1 Tax=Clostridium sp. BNL1100 TaxID=755731 RepID=UPI00024A7AA5|nr:hypothetical protein [Clostridium sp. BNL1100]AEY66621.1 hypothetical protein Clo1100_2451 [Clostridium sp. BNL1100]